LVSKRPAPAQNKQDTKKGCIVLIVLFLLIVGGCSALFDDDTETRTKSTTHAATSAPNAVALPDYTGYGLEQAEDKARSAGIRSLEAEDLSSRARTPASEDDWQVCGQLPVAGTEMSRTDTLTLKVVKLDEDCDAPDAQTEKEAEEEEAADAPATGTAEADQDAGSTGSTDSSVEAPDEPQAPAGASAQCNDGSYSYSAHRRGTCSHHGGVAVWLNANLPS
jgi:beta-lactam-binding protein with PASTA domain